MVYILKKGWSHVRGKDTTDKVRFYYMNKKEKKFIKPAIVTIVVLVIGFIIYGSVCPYITLWEDSLNISESNIKDVVEILQNFNYELPEDWEEISDGDNVYPNKTPIGIYEIQTEEYNLIISKFSGEELNKDEFYSCSPCYFENNAGSTYTNERFYEMIKKGEFENIYWLSTPLEAYINENEIIKFFGVYYGSFCIQDGKDAFVCQYSVNSKPSIIFGFPLSISVFELLAQPADDSMIEP